MTTLAAPRGSNSSLSNYLSATKSSISSIVNSIQIPRNFVKADDSKVSDDDDDEDEDNEDGNSEGDEKSDDSEEEPLRPSQL